MNLSDIHEFTSRILESYEAATSKKKEGNAVKKQFFVPEDFATCADHPFISQMNCDYANAKLRREAIAVRGWKNLSGTAWGFDNQKPDPTHTHTALLVCIEPIAKCDHKAPHPQGQLCGDYIICKCGAKLKQVITYEEIK